MFCSRLAGSDFADDLPHLQKPCSKCVGQFEVLNPLRSHKGYLNSLLVMSMSSMCTGPISL